MDWCTFSFFLCKRFNETLENSIIEEQTLSSHLCRDLGKKMREEADRVRQLQEEGYKTKLRYMEEGKKLREEKTVGYVPYYTNPVVMTEIEGF